MLPKKKILITGATGFLGSHLTKQLLKKGHELYLIVRKSSSLKKIQSIRQNVHLITVDIKNLEFSQTSLLESLPDCPDYIFHLATCYKNPPGQNIIWESNVEFPLFILNSYSNLSRTTFFNFDTSLNSSVNDYAKSKKFFINKIKNEQEELKIVNFILEMFYGPNDGRFIDFIITQFKNKAKEIPLTDGLQKRDLIYYKDVLSAVFLIINTVENKDFHYLEIPVGRGEEPTIRQIVEKVQDHFPSSDTLLKWGSIEMRPNEPQVLCANISYLKEFGWSPKWSLDEGVTEIIEEYT